MNGKRCTDCKYTRGIGFDFWCGEGHTEYEVIGAETNCPYYEYHDWSKGVPNMTKKRFDFEWDMNITDNITGKEYDLHCDEAFDFIKIINDVEKENEQLKEELANANELKEHLDYYKTKCGSLEESLIQKEREISMLKNIVGKIKVLDELIWWNGQKRRLKK